MLSHLSTLAAANDGAPSQAAQLRLLLWLRAALACGGTLAALFAVYGLDLDLSLWLLFWVLCATAAVTMVASRRLQSSQVIGTREIYWHIVADVVALTILLFSYGGPSNAFTYLYLLPVAVGVVVLPVARYAWSVLAVTAACYLGLFMGGLLDPVPAHGGSGVLNSHTIGHYIGFLASSALLVYFVLTLVAQVQERDRVLAEEREKRGRDQRLVELGTLAAGAAHELGTPLATMALLAGELAEDYPNDATIVERAGMFRQQLRRCKESLAVLSANAGQAQAQAGGRMRIDDYLRQTVDHWKESRRDAANVKLACFGAQPTPVIVVDRTLSHALINVINNAADASPEDVEIIASWSATKLQVDVCDRGPGFDPQASLGAGKTLFTTKGEKGMGIGLFLSYSTITRCGGAVDVLSRQGGGTCTRITLNLEHLGLAKERLSHAVRNISGNRRTASATG